MKKIAVIDDDAFVLDIIREHLALQGYQCEVFKCPLSFIEHSKNSNFDLVITDVHMEKVNGVELLAWLKKNQPFSKTILISGMITPEVKEKARLQGVSLILEKPLDFVSLCRGVRLLLREGISGSLHHLSLSDCLQIMGGDSEPRHLRFENGQERISLTLQDNNLTALEYYNKELQRVSSQQEALERLISMDEGILVEESFFEASEPFNYSLQHLLLQKAEYEDTSTEKRLNVQYIYLYGQHRNRKLISQLLVNMGFRITEHLHKADLLLLLSPDEIDCETINESAVPVWVACENTDTYPSFTTVNTKDMRLFRNQIKALLTSGFSGHFHYLSTVQFIQLVSESKMTAHFSLKDLVKKSVGELSFLKGQILEASYCEKEIIKGQEALNDILRMRTGVVAQSELPYTIKENSLKNKPLIKLLMQYMRPGDFELDSVAKIESLL